MTGVSPACRMVIGGFRCLSVTIVEMRVPEDGDANIVICLSADTVGVTFIAVVRTTSLTTVGTAAD